CDMYWEGFTITVNATTTGPIYFTSSGTKINYFKNCTFILAGSGTPRLSASGAFARIIFDNTKVQQNSTGTFIFVPSSGMDIDWRNTPSAVGGSTALTYLGSPSSNGSILLAARGVDFSGIASTASLLLGSSVGNLRALFDGCKIPAAITRFNPG